MKDKYLFFTLCLAAASCSTAVNFNTPNINTTRNGESTLNYEIAAEPKSILSPKELELAIEQLRSGHCNVAKDLFYHYLYEDTATAMLWLRKGTINGTSKCIGVAGAIMISKHFPDYNIEGLNLLNKAAACGNFDAALELYATFYKGVNNIRPDRKLAEHWKAVYDQLPKDEAILQSKCPNIDPKLPL